MAACPASYRHRRSLPAPGAWWHFGHSEVDPSREIYLASFETGADGSSGNPEVGCLPDELTRTRPPATDTLRHDHSSASSSAPTPAAPASSPLTKDVWRRRSTSAAPRWTNSRPRRPDPGCPTYGDGELPGESVGPAEREEFMPQLAGVDLRQGDRSVRPGRPEEIPAV